MCSLPLVDRKFTPKWFYIKRAAGRFYVGQTVKDVFKYKGSGSLWKKILNKHKIVNPETVLAIWCSTAGEFQYCLDTYCPPASDYIFSKVWANQIEETPWDGSGFEAGKANKGKLLGIPKSKSVCEAISKALKGKKKPWCAKEKNPMHRKDVKEKMSVAVGGSNNYRAKKVISPFGEFGSTTDASSYLGISPSTIQWRCRNKKNGWSYADT